MTKTKQPKKEITIEDIFDLFKESEKKFQVHLKEEEKREEKREEREEKADRERKREQKEWNKRFSEYSQSQGEIAKDLFRRSAKGLLKKRGIKVDTVANNLHNVINYPDKTKLEGEYDVVAINGNEVVIVEVKNKLKRDNVDNFIDKQIPNFKILFPQYKDYKIYGGVGALVVKPHIEKYAESKGLFVFVQKGEDGADILNDKDFKARVFS